MTVKFPPWRLIFATLAICFGSSLQIGYSASILNTAQDILSHFVRISFSVLYDEELEPYGESLLWSVTVEIQK